jgi:CAAX prenyl protease-like protein
VAGYLAPLMAVTFVALVTDLIALELDWWYGLRVVAGALVLWRLKHELPTARWAPAWPPVALGVAVFAMWLALVPVPDAAPAALAMLDAAPPTWRLTWIVMRVVGSVLLIPLVEELAFRGYLLRRLQATTFTDVPLSHWAWGPVLISSLAFGMLHQHWLPGLLTGIVFAYAQVRRGSIADAVVAHAVANALIAATVLFTDRWDLWL